VSFSLQLFVSGRFFARLGVIPALAVLPVGFAAAFGWMAAAPGLIPATAARTVESVAKQPLNDAAVQMLYLPMPDASRIRLKSAIDGTLRPIAGVALGLGLVAYSRFTTSQTPLAIAGAVLVVAWVGAVLWLRGLYPAQLRATLRRSVRSGAINETGFDPDQLIVTARTYLRSDEPAEILGALSLLPPAELAGMSGELSRLVWHPEPTVRRAVLEKAWTSGCELSRERVEHLLGAPDSIERAAAIRAYAVATGEDAVERLAPILSSPDPSLRAAALSGLLKHGGLEGTLTAGGELRRLLGSPDDAGREFAARLLADAGIGAFYRPVHRLLADPSPRVRRAAAVAAGSLGRQEAIPALIELLSDSFSAREAADALVAFGPRVETSLERVLSDRTARNDFARTQVPRALARIGSNTAIELLIGRLDDPHEAVRRAMYLALRQLARAARVDPGSPEVLRAALLVERHDAFCALRAAEALGAPLEVPRADAGPLVIAIQEELSRAMERILILLSALRPDEDVATLERNLRSEDPRARSNALEVIEAMVPRDVRRWLPTLLEGRHAAALAASPEWRPPAGTAVEWMNVLLADRSAVTRACVLQHLAAASTDTTGWRARAEGALSDPEAYVRLTAMVLLARVGTMPSAAAMTSGPPLAHRTSVRLRRAQTLLMTGALCKDGRMSATMTPIDKMLVLRSAPIFAEATAEDLAALGFVAEEVHVGPREEVFRAGAPSDSLYIVVSGGVEVHRGSRVLAHLGAREVFGEMGVLESSARSATVTSVHNTHLLRIARDDFQEVVLSAPGLAIGVMRVLSKRIRTLTDAGIPEAQGHTPFAATRSM
jgi:HEAT repeat protein